jgi:hypothetical protein
MLNCVKFVTELHDAKLGLKVIFGTLDRMILANFGILNIVICIDCGPAPIGNTEFTGHGTKTVCYWQ